MIEKYIFDFGDVFINLDKQATLRELSKFGLTHFTPEMTAQNHLYEKGLVTTDEFLGFYQKLIPDTTKEELRKIWNKILLDFPLYRLEFIEEFSKNNSCILLSNINEIHVDFIKKQVGKTFYNRFINCFDKVYYTHEINLRKPDKEIFEYVFSDLKIKPETCFFVDDRGDNIQTAKELGVTCWHINPKKEDVSNLKDKLKSFEK
jgi:putative hydrolase of the HAD superfamily